MTSITQKEILELLIDNIKNCKSEEDYRELTITLREKFLSAWSETPDNIQTSKHISIGEVENMFTKKKEVGLIMKSQNDLISNIVWQAFGNSKIPSDVREAYPSLSEEEWNQIFRICQFTLSLFEVDKK